MKRCDYRVLDNTNLLEAGMAGKKPGKKSITTKKGDQGETSLFDGRRVSKASLRPEAYGTLDEASAFIGLARAQSKDGDLKEILKKIQSLIYLVNAELACPEESKDRLEKRFKKNDLKWVEETAASLEKRLELPPRFVLYGGTDTGAVLDIARAVVRRMERTLTALEASERLDNRMISPFVNRLSDLLYLLARWDEIQAGVPFSHPET